MANVGGDDMVTLQLNQQLKKNERVALLFGALHPFTIPREHYSTRL
jgi:hypothetical protein